MNDPFPAGNRAGQLASFVAEVVAGCARRPARIVAIAGVVCALAFAYAASHLAIDTDSSKLIADTVPWRQHELAFDAAFPRRVDLVVVVVDGATPELAEQATATLADRLSHQMQFYRAVWRPDGGAFFERNGLLFESPTEVDATMQRLIAAQPLLGTLAADPTLRGLMEALSLIATGAQQGAPAGALVGPVGALGTAFTSVADGGTPAFSWQTLFTGRAPEPRTLRRFILVQPLLDYGALEPGARASASIRAAAHAIGLDGNPRVRVRLTGPVPLADEEFATLAQGAIPNAVVTLLAVIALLWIALRSWPLIVGILASLSAGLILTAALGLLAFGAFNLISVAFAVLFVGLGVDFGIQFCMAYRARRHGRDDIDRALVDGARRVGGALALAALSTAAGFLSFLPTDYRGVSELGVIAGVGMIIAFVATITLLPALLVMLPLAPERAPVGFASLAPLDRLLLRHRILVLGVAALIAAGAIFLMPRVTFDFNPLHLRSRDAESVAALLDLAKDSTTTPNTIDVLAPSLRDATKLGQRIAKLPEIDHVVTLASFIPEEQQEKLARIDDAAQLLEPTLSPTATRPPPSDAETAAAIARAARQLDVARDAHPGTPFAAAAERLARPLHMLANGSKANREHAEGVFVPGLVTTLAQLRAALQAAPVSRDTLPDSLVRDWVASDGRARIEVYPRGDVSDNAALARFVGAVRAVAPDATGAPVSIEASSSTIVAAFARAGIWALVFITVLLVVALRRASDVVRTLLPLALASLASLATCVVIGLPLNFENIIALPLLFGIGVAFNIYFVVAWRAGRGQPLQSSLARAVVMSGLTTGTAFGSLWLSHHPGTASMGELLALSLAWTLVSALLFLPALLGDPPPRA